VVISNPTSEKMPYYFVLQALQDDNIDNAEKFTGQLDPGEIRYLPLKLSQKENGLNFEFVSRSRKNGGEIKW
jgi:hypothetical protein